MKHDLKQLTLHTPIFVAQVNLGSELSIEKRPYLEMIYDEEHQRVFITMQGPKIKETRIIPFANCIAMTIKDGEIAEAPAPAPIRHGRIKAQVGGPTHHVFEGSGVEPK